MAQWAQDPTVAALVTVEVQVQSSALHSGLRFQHCHSLGSDAIPGPGTSMGCGCSQKQEKKGQTDDETDFIILWYICHHIFETKDVQGVKRLRKKISFSWQVYWKFSGTLYKRRVREQKLRLSALYCSPSATPLKEKYEATLENWQESSSLIRQSVICEAILKDQNYPR